MICCKQYRNIWEILTLLGIILGIFLGAMNWEDINIIQINDRERYNHVGKKLKTAHSLKIF